MSRPKKPKDGDIPRFDVNLDTPARERWSEVCHVYGPRVRALVPILLSAAGGDVLAGKGFTSTLARGTALGSMQLLHMVGLVDRSEEVRW